MKITYISHSSFSIEFEDIVLIFDYFQGSIPEFDPKKKIFVFSSHKHHDHYNREIFKLAEKYELIHFLLSNDIHMSEAYMDRIGISKTAIEKIEWIRKNTTCHYECGIVLETLTSTDQGVAFIVNYQEKSIYHAGDLNWWTWKGENDKEEKEMEKRFKNEIDKIKGRSFNAAFLPLDPRQEERYYWGLDYFMRNTDTKTVFPMHFWKDYSVITSLRQMDCSLPYRDKIQDINNEGQLFTIQA